MQRKVKIKIYDCDFYTKNSAIPYKTTMGMTWKDVLNAKKSLKPIGDKVIPTYSHTKIYTYTQ